MNKQQIVDLLFNAMKTKLGNNILVNYGVFQDITLSSYGRLGVYCYGDTEKTKDWNPETDCNIIAAAWDWTRDEITEDVTMEDVVIELGQKLMNLLPHSQPFTYNTFAWQNGDKYIKAQVRGNYLVEVDDVKAQERFVNLNTVFEYMKYFAKYGNRQFRVTPLNQNSKDIPYV